jgi:phosphoribosylaminoimidazole-succinocarboxamide synthase
MDKQFARNAVDQTGWDHTPPAPKLPAETIQELLRRYTAAVERITRGEPRPIWS